MIAASVLAAMFAAAPIEVHTATRDVRGCQALERGYVAATEGGVVFLDAAGVAEPALTALDGLPETRSYVVAPVAGSSTQVWAGTEGGLARIEHDQAGARVIVATSHRGDDEVLQHLDVGQGDRVEDHLRDRQTSSRGHFHETAACLAGDLAPLGALLCLGELLLELLGLLHEILEVAA